MHGQPMQPQMQGQPMPGQMPQQMQGPPPGAVPIQGQHMMSPQMGQPQMMNPGGYASPHNPHMAGHGM